MSAPLLAWRGLHYNAGSHLATALGIGVAAMVLAGALLVGDSLRASLRDRAMGRLGWIDSLLVAGRPFGQDLAASADGNATPAFLVPPLRLIGLLKGFGWVTTSAIVACNRVTGWCYGWVSQVTGPRANRCWGRRPPSSRSCAGNSPSAALSLRQWVALHRAPPWRLPGWW